MTVILRRPDWTAPGCTSDSLDRWKTARPILAPTGGAPQSGCRAREPWSAPPWSAAACATFRYAGASGLKSERPIGGSATSADQSAATNNVFAIASMRSKPAIGRMGTGRARQARSRDRGANCRSVTWSNTSSRHLPPEWRAHHFAFAS